MTTFRLANTCGWLVATTLLCLIVTGCETTAPPSTTSAARVAPSFDYTPAEVAGGDLDITLAVVGSSVETSVPMFKSFVSNMEEDFLEVLNAIGYRVRGPFGSYDEMTFPEKEGSELLLSADLSFDYDTSGLKAVPVASIFELLSATSEILGTGSGRESDSSTYTFSGPVILTSRVTLVLYESLTRERMWTKSLNLKPIKLALKGTHAFPRKEPPSLRELLTEENQFFTDLGRQLNAQYQSALHSTYTHLDPREVRLVSEQAETLRARKRF